jgi:hypothetical protein
MSWLLLIHQVPPEPGYLRVKVRRRLRGVGAVPLKSTVYVLPLNEAAREAFEWITREIRASGGEAILCEAHFVGGLSDEDVTGIFRQESDARYAEIARAAQRLYSDGSSEGQRGQLARLRRRVAAVAELDFFGASGRAAAEQAITDAEARLYGMKEAPVEPADMLTAELRGRVWVTRRGVHVDRMASAWLIRRFIDAQARFRFVDPDDYHQDSGELRFDMYEAEFTHEGDRCTFEVLCALAAPDDPALRAIAEIVHDIDLGDDKFGRVEAAGIDRLVAGIQTGTPGDDERLARAAEVFEALYRSYGGSA